MKVHKKYIEEIAELVLGLNNRKDILDFLEGILTPRELSEVSIRLQIVKRLKAGQAQRIIAEELGVGVATVTRGSKELQRGKFKYV